MSNLNLNAVLRIEITDEPVIPGRSGMTDGRAYTIPTKQPAYLHQGETYPTRIELAIGDKPPYRPGFYLLGGKAVVARIFNGRSFLTIDPGAAVLFPVEAMADLAKPSKAA